MNTEKETKERLRKTYRKSDGVSQKMMNFRLDNELVAWVESQPNRGRYLNKLIEADMKKKGA